MKFGKEFESQKVPQWQEAYMDYSGLKAVLKDVLDTRKGIAGKLTSSDDPERLHLEEKALSVPSFQRAYGQAQTLSCATSTGRGSDPRGFGVGARLVRAAL